jgi:hypothetical protein
MLLLHAVSHHLFQDLQHRQVFKRAVPEAGDVQEGDLGTNQGGREGGRGT